MNRGFVPLRLTPAGSSTGAATSGKPGENAPAPGAFQPVASADAAPSNACATVGEPRVTFERDGERVTRIRIQCCCGHIVELACSY